MKTKKYKHADLESKRGVFFQIGLIIALGASLAAFEWGSTPKRMNQTVHEEEWIEAEDMMPITRFEEKKQELPKPVPLTQLILIEDTHDGPDDDINFSSEITSEIIEIPEMKEEVEAPSTFFIVEKMPVFPGGKGALINYIANKVKYPVICVETSVEGKVYVSFVVNEYGRVVEAKIVRSPDVNLSKEALRVVNSMPQWMPGYQRDKAVRVAYTIPVNFVLQ